MINFVIIICVICYCKMKLLVNWNEILKIKFSYEEYICLVIIMESGKIWYGFINY